MWRRKRKKKMTENVSFDVGLSAMEEFVRLIKIFIDCTIDVFCSISRDMFGSSDSPIELKMTCENLDLE